MRIRIALLTAAAVLSCVPAFAAETACPDLSGTFLCPASERYKQAAMTVEVRNDLPAKAYTFVYDGKRSVKLSADGARKHDKKTKKWSRDFCRGDALVTERFASADAAKAAAWSEQRINKAGDYEVTATGGKVALVCRRVKPSP